MDNVLAFEAADFKLTIALMKAGRVVGDFCSTHLYGQDTELLPTIEGMLKEHRLAYDQLDLIATTRGPGSFTGLRVALATAEGLALASGRPAVAFNCFEWVAKSYASSRTNLLVALESKRKDVYCQLFNQAGDALKEPANLAPSEVGDYLEYKKVFCIGSGSTHLKTEPNLTLLAFPDHVMPDASDLCIYAKQQVALFGVQAFPCEPFYLRMPDVTVPKT